MANDITAMMKNRQLEGHVIEFATIKKGFFLIVSEDHNFHSTLRSTLHKHLAIADDCSAPVSNPDHIIKTIRDVSVRRKHVVLFMERMYEGKDTGFLVRQIKNAFDNVKIIILTGETEQQRLVLLHEIGADNFITKPVSVNTLVEKVAFTIRPQGKLGQLIDIAKGMVSRGHFDQGLKASRKILELKPNSAAGLLVMGDAYRGLNKLDKARDSYLQASESAHMYMEPLKKLADLYAETEEKEQQLHYLERLDQLSPLNVERKVDMGEIHVEMGNEQRAAELFEQAVMQAKREAFTYIGQVVEKIGHVYAQRDPAKAEGYYRQALEAKGDMLEKSDIATFNRLGITLRKQGKWADAIETYSKALKVSPDDENLYYNMAMACAEGKAYQDAISHLEKALAINPEIATQDKTIAYNMGLIFMRAEATEQASRFLTQAIKLDPDFTKAKQFLADLPQ